MGTYLDIFRNVVECVSYELVFCVGESEVREDSDEKIVDTEIGICFCWIFSNTILSFSVGCPPPRKYLCA